MILKSNKMINKSKKTIIKLKNYKMIFNKINKKILYKTKRILFSIILILNSIRKSAVKSS